MFAVMGFHTFGMLLLGLVDVEKGRLQAKATEHLRIHKGTGGEKGKEGEDLELVTVQVGGEETGDNDL